MNGPGVPPKKSINRSSSQTGATLRLLLGDEHALFRQGCRSLLECESDLQVIGEVATGREAVLAVQELRPDIALLAIEMSDMDGLTATEIIMKTLPMPVMIVTMHARTDYLLRAARVGASAYLLKHDDSNTWIASIRRIATGEYLLTPQQVQNLLRRFERSNAVLPAITAREALSEREIEVLIQLAHGASNREIALALNVKEKTVRNYLWQLSEKFHFGNRTKAALYALRNGIATLEDQY